MDHKKAIVIGATSVVSVAAGSVAGYILAKKRLEQKYVELLDERVIEAQKLFAELAEAEIEKAYKESEARHKRGKFETPEAALNHFKAKREVAESEAEEDNPDELILETRGQQYRAAVAQDQPVQVFAQRVPQPIKDDDVVNHNGILFRRKEFNLDPEARSALKEAADEALANYKSTNPDYTPAENLLHNIFENGTLNGGGEEVPYVISSDEFLQSDSGYDSVTLTYYVGDDTLAHEREEKIDDVDETVGEHNLGKFGERSKDPNVVYIRNDQRMLDIELIRSPGKYSKEVLGLEDDDTTIGVIVTPRSIRSHRRGGRG